MLSVAASLSPTSMSSRSAYTALTPEDAVFPIAHTPVPSGLNPSSSSLRFELEHELSELTSAEGILSRIHSWLASAKDVMQRNTGLLFFVAAQACLSFMNLAVKILNSIDPPITASELIAIRMIITYLCCVAYMIPANVPDPILGPKGVRLLLLLRGFTGFFGLFGIYYSLQYLSLSDATVLTFLTPMCTAMAGALFLGENFARRKVFAGLVSLVGVVLIARPTAIFGSASHPDAHVPTIPVTDGQLTTPISPIQKGTQTERLIAVGVALIGVLGASGAYTIIRAIGKRAHSLHSTMFQSFMSSILSVVGIIVMKTPVVVSTRIDWLALVLLIGIFGFVAQMLLTIALQRETAGRSTMAIYTQIVFTVILEKIVFNVVPSTLSITGTLLILGSAVYVALTKEQEDTSIPKDTNIAHLSQDAELEEGLLDSPWEDGDKLDRNDHFGDDDMS